MCVCVCVRAVRQPSRSYVPTPDLRVGRVAEEIMASALSLAVRHRVRLYDGVGPPTYLPTTDQAGRHEMARPYARLR